ncbi:hypothetical protein CSV77_11280 [Sporosarcina sp. P16b]|uniref:hypothetical protein n=1 Tax=Sporosarcina sp. P16b TaxID=2048261 RepID=UPI000C172ACB|nr:hypothetical protein [Sporosarcina sp. P16b]PIC69847.1 hypothetical protein CSV77_11280 [Sporosarcina sp. P16b]
MRNAGEFHGGHEQHRHDHRHEHHHHHYHYGSQGHHVGQQTGYHMGRHHMVQPVNYYPVGHHMGHQGHMGNHQYGGFNRF